MKKFDLSRRSILRWGLGLAATGVAMSLDPFGLLPQAQAEEFKPFCEHVTPSMRRELEAMGYQIGICNECLNFHVGSKRVSLYEGCWVDAEPGIYNPRMVSAPVFNKSKVNTILGAMGQPCLLGANMEARESPDNDQVFLEINGVRTRYIWKIIQDVSGVRYLVYSKDGLIPWWQEQMPENVVGVVLGAADLDQSWDHSYSDRGRWCPVSSFAHQVAMTGTLSLRANAVIMFG